MPQTLLTPSTRLNCPSPKVGAIVLDHSDEEENGAAPTLGAWWTHLDEKWKSQQSIRQVQKALKEPRGEVAVS